MNDPRISSDVNFVPRESATPLLRDLREAGWKVLAFEGGASCDSFFEAVTRVLPQDPPIGPFPNWDGFADSLSGGIIELGRARLAIVWCDADRMQQSDPDTLAMAVGVFRQAAGVLRDERSKGRATAEVRTYLLGFSGAS